MDCSIQCLGIIFGVQKMLIWVRFIVLHTYQVSDDIFYLYACMEACFMQVYFF